MFDAYVQQLRAESRPRSHNPDTTPAFWQLLAEHQVSRDSRWAEVSGALAQDPRFAALGKGERARAFAAYQQRLAQAQGDAERHAAKQARLKQAHAN